MTMDTKENETKITIQNDPETFDKLMKLANFYSKTFKEYNKVLLLLRDLPRDRGQVVLSEAVFAVIESYLEDYEGLNAYAAREMSKDITIQ